MDKYNTEGYKDLTAYKALRNIEKEEENFNRLKLIYVCSPFAGDVEYNISRARGYSRFVMSKGFIPLAPHLLFPQFLDDEDKEEREIGITYGLYLLKKCNAIWVFGGKLSEGMLREIKWAKRYGIRKKENVISRTLGLLDADNIPEAIDFIKVTEEALKGVKYFIYSTHSHTPKNQRYRLVILLKREVSKDEYSALMRMVANDIGMDYFDDSTYQANRMMYWASCPTNGEFVFMEKDGEPLEPEKYLSRYENWKDCSQWPTSSRQSEVIYKGAKKQEDPLDKKGAVGAFCRAYTIEDAIDTFLPDIYEPSLINGRYDYTPADSIAGVVLYENKWAFSHHASDPASEKLVNAFDLVRIHKFGDLDTKASFRAMCEFAVKDEKVNEVLLAEKREEAAQEFEDWTDGLQRDKGGLLLNNLHNITLIIENDPALKAIVFNQLADGLEIKGEVPWIHPSHFWRDADDAQLISYVDANYGTFSARNYELAITKVAEKLYLTTDLEELAKAEQREAMEVDEREGIVLEYLDRLLPDNWDDMDIYTRQDYIRSPDDPTLPKGTILRRTVSNMEIWCECFGKHKEDIRLTDSYAIAAIMRLLS